MTRDEILAANPLQSRIGTLETKTNLCPVVKHSPGHLCVTIDPVRQLWHCNDCDVGGTVIDWMMKESGRSAKEVMDELSGAQNSFKSSGSTKTADEKQKQITAIYDYTNELGALIFQVVRYEPKAFRQRRPVGDGWEWDLKGVTRVLYNLPQVLLAKEVVVTEGERDCKTLASLGFIATCNAGGASAWLAAYGDYLKGKDVIIVPDSDEPGRKWTASVLASLENKASSVKVITVPSKDVSEWAPSSFDIQKLILGTPHIIPPDPLFDFDQVVERLHRFVHRAEEFSFDMCKFLPSLGTRPLVPGELALLLADTGVGKSMLLQAIAKSAFPLPTLFFELELPLELMGERFIQLETGCFGHEVVNDFRDSTDPKEYKFPSLGHLLICPEAGLTAARIEHLILRSELKFGKPPVLVLVDYVGLIRSDGKSRYETVSDVAEAMKEIAKKTNTIVILASQVARPDRKKKSVEVGLHDAKDSGALENSAGLVLGCWRPERNKLVIRILKNTKGFSGHTVECDFDGARMLIKEATF